MNAWDRFKQRAIHHNEQHAAFVRDELDKVRSKKRRLQILLLLQTGEAPPAFWTWLDKKKNRRKLMERILRADGLMQEIIDLLNE